jgi:hypothetical protein
MWNSHGPQLSATHSRPCTPLSAHKGGALSGFTRFVEHKPTVVHIPGETPLLGLPPKGKGQDAEHARTSKTATSTQEAARRQAAPSKIEHDAERRKESSPAMPEGDLPSPLANGSQQTPPAAQPEGPGTIILSTKQLRHRLRGRRMSATPQLPTPPKARVQPTAGGSGVNRQGMVGGGSPVQQAAAMVAGEASPVVAHAPSSLTAGAPPPSTIKPTAEKVAPASKTTTMKAAAGLLDSAGNGHADHAQPAAPPASVGSGLTTGAQPSAFSRSAEVQGQGAAHRPAPAPSTTTSSPDSKALNGRVSSRATIASGPGSTVNSGAHNGSMSSSATYKPAISKKAGKRSAWLGSWVAGGGQADAGTSDAPAGGSHNRTLISTWGSALPTAGTAGRCCFLAGRAKQDASEYT